MSLCEEAVTEVCALYLYTSTWCNFNSTPEGNVICMSMFYSALFESCSRCWLCFSRVSDQAGSSVAAFYSLDYGYFLHDGEGKFINSRFNSFWNNSVWTIVVDWYHWFGLKTTRWNIKCLGFALCLSAAPLNFHSSSPIKQSIAWPTVFRATSIQKHIS